MSTLKKMPPAVVEGDLERFGQTLLEPSADDLGHLEERIRCWAIHSRMSGGGQ